MSIQKPLVSVIIPVYNVFPYLGDALDSVINQTYSNLEIIIINDGSTDGSGELCNQYLDSRIKTVHQPNKGLSSARNTGLDLMSGDIVAFLDSDDVFYPNMIQTLVEEMRKSSADIVSCNFVWDGIESKYDESVYSSKEALKGLINGRMETAVWNKIYKRFLWDDVRFPEGHVYEGTRTTYKVLEKAKWVKCISASLMFHRKRSDSITQTKSINNMMDLLFATQELEDYARDHTPSIFSSEEVNQYIERKLCLTIKIWLELVNTYPTEAENLRRDIIKRKDEKQIKALSLQSVLTYSMMKYCPHLLRLIYPAYLKFRSN